MLSIVCMGNEADHSMTVIVSQIIFISVKFQSCHIHYERQFLPTCESEILTVGSCAFDTKLCQDYLGSNHFAHQCRNSMGRCHLILISFSRVRSPIQVHLCSQRKETETCGGQVISAINQIFKTKQTVIPSIFFIYYRSLHRSCQLGRNSEFK